MAENLSQGNFEKESGLEGIVSNRPKIAVFSFFFLGLFLLALGVGLFLFRGEAADKDIEIISTSEENLPAGRQVVVHVDGAVIRPGVYQLKADSRVGDAINAAGGLATSADQSKINLAAKVADGQKIYIARIGEEVKGTTSITSTTGITGLININTASESELDKLPGVGPVTAAKIIASRPYSAPEELLTKKVVNTSVYEKIKGLIAY